MIPKIIHYCWFGEKPLPKSAQKCLASWKKVFPDYNIKEWNESNFDVNIIPYTEQAYNAKKYAFVSDYARFYILYHHGGVYFDTDVEVIKPMDDIIEHGSFMGCEIDGTNSDDSSMKVAPGLGIAVNPGLGIAANPGLGIYKEILDYYEGMHYLQPNGKPFPGTVVTHTTKILCEHGLKNICRIQSVSDITIYPTEYFNPYDDPTGKLNITPNTRSIHWYSKTWMTPQTIFRSKITRVFHRLFGVDCFRWLKR